MHVLPTAGLLRDYPRHLPWHSKSIALTSHINVSLFVCVPHCFPLFLKPGQQKQKIEIRKDPKKKSLQSIHINDLCSTGYLLKVSETF